MKKILHYLVFAITIIAAASCSKQAKWNHEQKEALRNALKTYREMIYLQDLTEPEFMVFTDDVAGDIEGAYPVYASFVQLPAVDDTLDMFVVTAIVEQLNENASNMRHIYPYHTLVKQGILPDKLTHDERQELYRTSSRNETDDIHRQVLTSMITSALDEYDDSFLLGLSMDLYPEEDERPTAVEVAVTGKGSHRDESNNCFVYLSFLEVEILEHAIAQDLVRQRAYLSEPIPDGVGFEEWLDMSDFNRSVYRRSTALFEKIVGHPYDPADYDYDVIEEHGKCPDDEDGDKGRESPIEG
jgi:hypothetical protein